ncbi:hypothetical protein DICPUDRAFT_151387 [Dictyostelium purpureum]|uniref:Uncharacterized protein n=1 Tax=Dictyostelium purpureum TaxID=5786 RepID=F0ZIP9_DICPU|nr:uncharacterized protein DICPUDRAFT_151387 [Dictyostelium purpureum]EGC36158.1 hypothetical protein DICPUDRAFT_151387 [Dictyostelium purpureum]|eukprot:XP_003287291.1 hypothetical protein DICPUDRAFT_151387 [Dictyostelium purpureum]
MERYKNLEKKDKSISANQYDYDGNLYNGRDLRTLTKGNFLSRCRNVSDEDIAFIMHASTE